ncbi:MAG: hypothetical protein AAFO77_05505 [Pseudomonadota bacterium]
MPTKAQDMRWQDMGIHLDEVLRLVGRINYAWSNTESLLIHFLAGLARVDNETATILFLSLNTSRARLDLVKRLARAKCDDQVLEDRIIKFTAEMSSLGKQRNALNHSLYAFDGDLGEVRTIEMRIADTAKGLKMGRQQVLDAAEVARIAKTIDRLVAVNAEAWSIIRSANMPH